MLRLQFLARQGLAFCGDKSDDDSNFMQTLKLGSKDIRQLMDWRHSKWNNSNYGESNDPRYNS